MRYGDVSWTILNGQIENNFNNKLKLDTGFQNTLQATMPSNDSLLGARMVFDWRRFVRFDVSRGHHPFRRAHVIQRNMLTTSG